MEIFAFIAERKIQEAMEAGLFDNLPGRGKPLDLEEDYGGMPYEQRMANKVLRNANVLPAEMTILKMIAALKEKVDSCDDPQLSDQLKRKLRQQQLHYDVLMEKNTRSARVR